MEPSRKSRAGWREGVACAWGNSPGVHPTRLERAEERGLRAVFRDTLSSWQQLLEKSDLPTLYNRRVKYMRILMYKFKHNLYPQTICNFFYINCHTYSLRQRDFYLP